MATFHRLSEVFSASSTPTFATQHTIAGLVLGITLVLLDGPRVSEQNTAAPSLQPHFILLIQKRLHPGAVDNMH